MINKTGGISSFGFGVVYVLDLSISIFGVCYRIFSV